MTAALLGRFIADWASSPFSSPGMLPWIATGSAEQLVARAVTTLGTEYAIVDGIAVHRSALIEGNVVLKGPVIVGPSCLVAAGSYLRGGVYLADNCIVGPGSELKSSFMFVGSKLAHLNFVGDSIIGARVNIEAGAVVANFRNELVEKTIRIAFGGEIIETGTEKFGALIGDDVRIGANAVIAPGALLSPGTVVRRLSLVDQYPIDAIS